MNQISRIHDIIRSNELDTLVVFSASKEKIDQVTDSNPDELCTAVSLINESFPGPIRVEGSKCIPTGKRGPGRPLISDKPFVWILPGIQKTEPVRVMAAPVSETVTVPDMDSIRMAEKYRAECLIKQAIIEQLEQERESLLTELDELNSEAEQIQQNMAAPIKPPPFWESEEGIMRVMNSAVELFGKIKGATATKNAAPVKESEGLTEKEKQLVNGFRNFSASDPVSAEKASEFLMNFASND